MIEDKGNKAGECPSAPYPRVIAEYKTNRDKDGEIKKPCWIVLVCNKQNINL